MTPRRRTPRLLLLPALTVCLGATALAACSGDGSPPTSGSAQPGPGSAATDLDPQVFSDVVAGVFPLPGRSQLRTIRVIMASVGLPNAACGGKNFADPGATDLRQDQARYADLELIAAKGLVERTSQPKPVLVAESCLAAKTPSQVKWWALIEPWSEITRTAALSEPVVATHARVARCLREESGLTVDQTDPTASFLNSVDRNLSGAADPEADSRSLSSAYATCTREYFDILSTQLRPQQEQLVERNRELLERYAGELAAIGYVP
jgi:hypothetical protein